MAGVNKAIIVGNVGADPEFHETQTQKPVARFRVATNEVWKDKNTGERRESVEWHTVVCFNEGLCNVIRNYVKKGSRLYVSGTMKTRKWTDNKGIDRWTTEIILSGFNAELVLVDSSSGGGSRPPIQDEAPEGPGSSYDNPYDPENRIDDEIPF